MAEPSYADLVGLANQLSRIAGLLKGPIQLEGSEEPDNLLGAPGASAFNLDTRTWYGPKNPVTGWGEGIPMTQGPQGPAGTITGVTVSTGAAGSNASVVLGGAPSARTIALTIPRGDKGDTGDDAAITGVTVSTGAPGTEAAVTAGGTAQARTFAFTIPRGDKGDTGDDATITDVTATTGAAGSGVSVTVGGTPGARTLAFTIPRGDTGATPDLTIGDVTTGPAGSSADATLTGTAEEPILNLTVPQGDKGDTGDAAWTPVFATVVDGARRVLRITDWTGGGGTKPATGAYLGPTGFVATAAEATDVRGAAGAGSGDMIAAYNLSDLTDKAAARTTLDVYSKGEGDARYPVLSGGKIAASVLPSLAITDIFTVSTEAAMLALDAQRGDVAVREDLFATFILAAEPASTLANWIALPVPTDVVQSVAGLQGAISAAALKSALAIAIADVSGLAAALGAIPVKASGADLRALTDDAKFLTPKAVADAAALAPLTDGATIAVDLSAGTNFSVTLGGNRALGSPSNAKPGMTGSILIKQDASGSRTLAFGSAWKAFGGAPVLSTAANAVDLLTFLVEESGKVRFTLAKGGAA